MLDMNIGALEKRVESLEKEIAELKGQVSERHEIDIDKVAEELVTRLQESAKQQSAIEIFQHASNEIEK